LSTYARSSPNAYGTFSYIATSFSIGTSPDPLLFGSYDAVTFVLGSATIDPAAFLTNDIPLLKDINFSGTELFPGHGPYSVRLTTRHGGVYTHKGSVYTFSSNYDFEGTFLAGPATASNADANGTVVLLEPSQFDAPDLTQVESSLAAYIKSVAIPLAKSSNANGLLCGQLNLHTAASNPGTTGSFPALVGYSVLIALDMGAGSSGEIRITNVQLTPDGAKLQWTSNSPQTYSVEATSTLSAPFVTIASNLTQPEYVDQGSAGQRTRFYRVRSP
jgi:hypothetical protein